MVTKPYCQTTYQIIIVHSGRQKKEGSVEGQRKRSIVGKKGRKETAFYLVSCISFYYFLFARGRGIKI